MNADRGGEQGLALWGKIRFAGDSPLEEDGFELQVPFFEMLCRVLSKGNAER